MKKIKEPIIFDDYDSLINYIEDTVKIDTFIIESVNDFIDNKTLNSIELDLECKEINKIMKIIYERDMIPDVLQTVMKRYLEKEEYEKCSTIRDLLNKIETKNA